MRSCITMPIAIVGVGLRFPGGCASLADLWSILRDGRDLISSLPADRWDTDRFYHPNRVHPGTTVSVQAGVLEHIYDFDAAFFGISPKEAASMDPQQRILLELTWEALEDAGICPSSLAGSDTAVVVGAASPDSGTCHADDLCATSPYSMTGTNLSIIANRISYIFDFHGPSFTLDTACSSSLYALYQAALLLAQGASQMALACGVNVLLAPYPFVGFSQAHMLSQSGRCKVFDAAGDGYVRSEGGGVLVLEPLTEALAHGRHIHAVIRGVDCNSDGRTQGIALPSAKAQESLLATLYDAANCHPDRLAYLEAHGTGTTVGDPIEALAIGRALGSKRSQVLPIGSVKCALGHLETASAMAGIMKALTVLDKRAVPPQIHITKLNPAIDFAGLHLHVPLTLEPISDPAAQYVGVNSFGFGGANGHVLLEAARDKTCPKSFFVPNLFIQAKSEASLAVSAKRLAKALEATPENEGLFAETLAFYRDAMPERLLVTGEDTPTLMHKLSAYASGDFSASKVVSGRAILGAKTAFVFAGNGCHWQGMGRDLLRIPCFADKAQEVAELFRAISGIDLLDLLVRADSADLERTEVTQPLLFLIQTGLCAVLAEQGIVPDLVFGHSVGEVSAVQESGLVSLKDAVRIVYIRSLCQGKTKGLGRMAAAKLSPERFMRLAREVALGEVELAGINAPSSLTLSGSERGLLALKTVLEGERSYCKMLPLDYAFHSKAMEGIREELLSSLSGITTHAPRIPFLSSVGQRIPDIDCERFEPNFEPDDFGAEYWWRNIRYPVLFHATAMRAIAMGVRLFLEISPHAILQQYLRQALRAANAEGWVGHSMQKNADNAAYVTDLWKTAWVHGWPDVLHRHLSANHGFIRSNCPTYAFAANPVALERSPECRNYLLQGTVDPLLGYRDGRSTRFESVLDLEKFPWLADHKVGESVLYPAACFLEMTFACGAAQFGAYPLELSNTAILRPVSLEHDHSVVLATSLELADGEVRTSSRPYMQEAEETIVTRGRLKRTSQMRPEPYAFAHNPASFGESVPCKDLVLATQACNMVYGPVFSPVQALWKNGESLLAKLAPNIPDNRLLFPPNLVDAGLQLLFLLVSDSQAPWLPYWFDRCVLYAKGTPAYALFTLEKRSERTITCSLVYTDETGAVLLTLSGGRARVVPRLAMAPLADYVATRFELDRVVEASVPDELFSACKAVFNQTNEANEPDPFDALLAASCEALLPEIESSRAPAEYVRRAALHRARFEALPDFAELWQTLFFERSPDHAPLALLLAGIHAYIKGENVDLAPLKDAYAKTLLLEALPHVRKLLAPFSGRTVIVNGFSRSALWQLEPELSDLDLWICDPSLHISKTSSSAHYVPWDITEESTHKECEDAALPLAHGILLANTLNLADDLVRALARVRDRLLPGGLLLLLEPHPSFEQDILNGLDSTWWTASKENGDPVSRLMPHDSWEEALTLAGFTDVHSVSLRGASLLLARRGRSGSLQKSLTLPFVCDSELGHFGEELVQTLAPYGIHAQCTTADLARTDSWGDLFAHSLLVIPVGVDVEPRDVEPRDEYAAVLHATRLVTALAQAWDANGRPAVRFVFLLSYTMDSPWACALLGALRVAANEYPDCALFRIAVHGCDYAANLADALLGIAGGQTFERELRLLGPKRLCERAYTLSSARSLSERADGSKPTLRLAIDDPGHLESLSWIPVSNEELPPDCVRIRVCATGLNFRDVLWAMNLLPEEALEQGLSGPCLGIECAGEIEEVGSSVTEFAQGDRVCAFAAHCFASHVTTRAATCVKIPDEWDMPSAATVPVAFCTAYYALVTLAHMQEGERLLLHGAAGGVGLAAIQIAMGLGVQVYATAGSEAKRALIRLLGVQHVYDSRSLDFAEAIRKDTGGEGVDCVLNSLAGEAMNEGLALLRPFGRFLELGKSDFYANSPLRLRPFRQNISYFGIDLDQLMREREDLGARLFREVMQKFAEGLWFPLPANVYPAAFVDEAFRSMQQSRHVGKIVVIPPKSELGQTVADERASMHPLFPVEPNASYLVTGGTQGFGLATAEQLLARGAKSLVLISRSGVRTQALDALKERYPEASIVPLACDVTDEGAIAHLFSDILPDLPTLRGIVHAAALLDDGLVASMTEERLARVLLPKVKGALLLHEASRNLPLDFFVVYSSVTTLIGNPGQVNYVAANAAMEGLIRRRRALGLPGQAIAWGAIADTGMLERDQATRDRLAEKSGIVPMKARDALSAAMDLAERCVLPPVVTVFRCSWKAFSAQPQAKDPRFANLLLPSAFEDREATWLEQIAGFGKEESYDFILHEVTLAIARVVRAKPQAILPGQSLLALGIDSLMGVELGLALEERAGRPLGLSLRADATPESIAGQIVARLISDERGPLGSDALGTLAEQHGLSQNNG